MKRVEDGVERGRKKREEREGSVPGVLGLRVSGMEPSTMFLWSLGRFM